MLIDHCGTKSVGHVKGIKSEKENLITRHLNREEQQWWCNTDRNNGRLQDLRRAAWPLWNSNWAFYYFFLSTQKGQQISSTKNGPPTVFCDNYVCVGAAIFVNMVHGFRHAVDHLHAALQVTVLCPQRLCLWWAECQVGGELRACMNLNLVTRECWNYLTCINTFNIHLKYIHLK